MANLNKVLLIGNLTRDIELRYTPKGSAVTDISMAINRTYTLESGERREETVYVDVVLWGRQAELASQYLHKGRPVFIEGRLQLDTWDDKETGQKRSKLRVVGEQMQFIGGRNDAPAQQQAAPYPQQGTGSAPGYSSKEPFERQTPLPPNTLSEPDFESEEDDDIPF